MKAIPNPEYDKAEYDSVLIFNDGRKIVEQVRYNIVAGKLVPVYSHIYGPKEEHFSVTENQDATKKSS